jgi:hypothetical protein
MPLDELDDLLRFYPAGRSCLAEELLKLFFLGYRVLQESLGPTDSPLDDLPVFRLDLGIAANTVQNLFKLFPGVICQHDPVYS